MNLVLFGPPGAGKGTQSGLLVEKFHYKHVSTGDLLRVAVRNETELGKRAKAFMDAGKLVPDEVVIGLIDEELLKLKGQGLVLDGFPRTVPQADALRGLMQRRAMDLHRVIFLEVPRADLMGRLTGRRVCGTCGSVFHIASKPPKVDGVCDACGGRLVQRSDDKEEVISARLDAYDRSTLPLKEYYKQQGKLVQINGTGETAEVFERIAKIVG